ncbi:hypothetical protein D6T17_27195 [Salmonella enterica subsp. enterica serovar Oranienburg]|uniref:GTPase n=1 Tax=Salmonella enterica TaxID=28901 RepID=A0A742RLQ7_SALER|nr:hypothetical protein [Salmonella enterica subsp. enterica serovar Oranienburg]HAF1420163.1 hypothetical protein [Salmonella enterica]EBY8947908.1 hypothetical protein [Salmonella enterica subsp. enterica serovar Oranienburg]HAF2207224.1 hypothetical protein [Salmonella enterica]HAF2376036.1 hypothetical protein [Salmonella enterica]
MSVESGAPELIYQEVFREIEYILASLPRESIDESLQKTNEDLRLKLETLFLRLTQDIERLKRNAEWDIFTIAFYGETNAGKSTVIETLRILLKEKSKQQRQKDFREFQQQHQLTESDIEKLQRSVDDSQKRAGELIMAAEAMRSRYAESETALQQQISALSERIYAQQHASLWKKLLSFWRETPEQKEYAHLLVKQKALNTEKITELGELERQHTDCDKKTTELQRLQTEQQKKLADLTLLADGEIIGTGVSDFTVDTTLYPFEVGNQRFALLDVPGIEGKEKDVLAQIQQAVGKAHAVFYVTGKAAAPQKGDENNPGTLEKIKSHLNAQTEVWTLFNKRITSPLQLNRPALLSPDEEQSLAFLNEKMREQLGDNYCDVRTLSAMPAFLSVAEHLVPGSENYKKREKLSAHFSQKEVLSKTGMSSFLNLLTDTLVAGTRKKIVRANINRVQKILEETRGEIACHQQTYDDLSTLLDEKMQDAYLLLDKSLDLLKFRLADRGEKAIEEFKNCARRRIYAEIDSSISNDSFKRKLKECITEQHEVLEKELPGILGHELTIFQKDTGEVMARFQQYAREILDTCYGLQQYRFDGVLDVKIDTDSGIRSGELLATLAGSALLLWNPVGWIVLAPALAGMVFSVYKAVRNVFSDSYKMSQQRQSADQNLQQVVQQIRASFNGGLKSGLSGLEEKVKQLKTLLEDPVRQTSDICHVLTDAGQKLHQLSISIETSGAK